MGFQTTVRQEQTFGFVGEIIEDTPHRARPGIIVSGDAANNVIARAFTQVNNQDDQVQAGGTGYFAGIFINSKNQVTAGAATGALDPTLTVPNRTQGEFLYSGVVIVEISNAANIGDNVYYDNTTGALQAGTSAPSGHTQVPSARVVRRNIPAPSGGATTIQAIIELFSTN